MLRFSASLATGLAWLGLWSATTWAQQPESPVMVSLQPERVALGETAELIVEVSPDGIRGQVEDPELPEIDGADVVGQSRESRVQMSGTSITRQFVFRYRLRPSRAGTLEVGPVQVVVDGTVYRSKPRSLVVLEGAGVAALPAPAGGPGDKELPGLFVVARVDRDEVFVGQQVTLTFAFYHDPRTPLAESPDYDPPETPGCWRVELDDEPHLSTERIGSRMYHVQRFRYALFPLQPGTFTIEPATVRVIEPDATRWWRSGQTRTLSTEPLTMTAKELPQGAPAGFNGAVGRYGLTGGLVDSETIAGVPLELELVVEGEGNPTALGPPVLPAWPEVSVQQPRIESETGVSDGRVTGTATYRYLLAPENPGRIPLGVARLAYFDPISEAYVVDTLRLGEVEVAAALGTLPTPTARAERGPTLWPARDPRTPFPNDLSGRPWYWIGLTGPWLAWLGVVGAQRAMRRRQRDPRRQSARDLRAAREALLAGAEGAGSSALHAIDSLLEAWSGHDTPASLTRAAEEARATLMAASYSGQSGHDVEQALGDLIAAAEKNLSRNWGSSTGLGVMVFVMLIAATATAQRDVAESPEASWRAANASYQAGDFRAATDAFARLLDSHADPHLAANRAASLWRMGSRGEAVAEYYRALSMAPREAVIRADLEQLRETLGFPPEDWGVPAQVLGRLRLDELLLALFFLNGLAFLVMLGGGPFPSLRSPGRAATAGTFVIALVCLAHGWTFAHLDRGVVLGDVTLAATPGGVPIADLAEGSVVEVLGQAPGGWRVRLGGSPAGWVAEDQIVWVDSSLQ